jgi:hypothetical protein
MDETEMAALARKDTAMLLTTLAKVADSPTAAQGVREQAQRDLESSLVQIKNLLAGDTLDPDVRCELEEALRKFRHS